MRDSRDHAHDGGLQRDGRREVLGGGAARGGREGVGARRGARERTAIGDEAWGVGGRVEQPVSLDHGGGRASRAQGREQRDADDAHGSEGGDAPQKVWQ